MVRAALVVLTTSDDLAAGRELPEATKAAHRSGEEERRVGNAVVAHRQGTSGPVRLVRVAVAVVSVTAAEVGQATLVVVGLRAVQATLVVVGLRAVLGARHSGQTIAAAVPSAMARVVAVRPPVGRPMVVPELSAGTAALPPGGRGRVTLVVGAH